MTTTGTPAGNTAISSSTDAPAGVVIDWMRHGISLCHDLLWAADMLIHRGRMSQVEKKRLEHELQIRQRVLDKFLGARVTLTPLEEVWRRYILAHIGLEIQRYAGEIDQAEFLTRCKALREKRHEEGRRCV